MWIRWRKRRRGPGLAGGKVGLALEKGKRKFAHWLQVRFERLPARMQVSLFVVFFVAVAMASLYLISYSRPKLTDNGKIVSVPLLPEPADPMAVMRGRVEALRFYLDSLLTTPEGEQRRAKILDKNPGLLDSLALWEKQVSELN